MFLGVALSKVGFFKKEETKEAILAVVYRAFALAEIAYPDLLTLIKIAAIEKISSFSAQTGYALH